MAERKKINAGAGGKPEKEESPKSRRYLASKEVESANVAAAKSKTSDKTAEKPPITPDMNIMDLVHNYPEAVPVLIEAGLHCIGCQLSSFDTLEGGCRLHGFDDEMIAKLVKEMNERVKNFKA